MAKIVVCLLTYERTDYAVKTLRSFLDNVVTGHSLSVHIADDGSSVAHRDTLAGVAWGHSQIKNVYTSNSERGGYGRNVNLATQVMHNVAEYILMLEDDWELTRELNLDYLVEDIASQSGISCVRLGYLSHTQMLRGYVRTIGPRHSKYLEFDPNSDEPHVFAGHPRLETVDFQRRIGAWPEGLSPGETEFSVAHIMTARTGVAWPMDLVRPCGDLFAHIGTVRSY